MSKIISHTLVKDGMPFIEPIIDRVMPYVNRSFITIPNVDSPTMDAVKRLKKR
jgi:hypothetical protein